MIVRRILRRPFAYGGSVEWGFRTDMPEVPGAAHLVVLPSCQENFSKALIEAAAAGRAVVRNSLLARPFLDHWLGAKFSEVAAPVAEILLIGTFLNGVAVVPFSILRAQGRPDAVAKIHAIELVPFVAVLWLCLRAFALPGAALAWDR